MSRYPEGITVSIETLRNCGWKAAIGSGAGSGYFGRYESLSAAAQKAIESGQLPEGKCLWLLADACSMMLDPSSLNEPFKPFASFRDRRSATPEDFAQSDIALFAEFVQEVDDVWLRARIADLVWLLMEPKSPQYARLAIDSYIQIPLDVESWNGGGHESWARAIALTRMLGAGSDGRIGGIEGTLLAAFSSLAEGDNLLASWIADLIEVSHLGRSHAPAIAAKLESAGRAAEESSDPLRCREYFSRAGRWFLLSGDSGKSVEMTVRQAEAFAKEAVARECGESASHIVASHFFEDAIRTYRTIPRSERLTYRVDERVTELRESLANANAKSLGEMSVITTEPIDISGLVATAKDLVAGKSAVDAIHALANIHSWSDVDQLRKTSERLLREYPFRALAATARLSRDGRKVARRPAASFGDDSGSERDMAVWAGMIDQYLIELTLAVAAGIRPALQTVRLEHRIRETDFVNLAGLCPVVPTDRRLLVGRALFAGYDNDFISCMHLLVPQIENIVRTQLKAAGAKTTTLDEVGIEAEIGLSALLKIPQVVELFGKDLAFELEALFCDPFGPNLRNEVAHGLVGEAECQSDCAIYAWWLALRIVFNTAVRKHP